jgi:hypothetical protein
MGQVSCSAGSVTAISKITGNAAFAFFPYVRFRIESTVATRTLGGAKFFIAYSRYK